MIDIPRNGIMQPRKLLPWPNHQTETNVLWLHLPQPKHDRLAITRRLQEAGFHVQTRNLFAARVDEILNANLIILDTRSAFDGPAKTAIRRIRSCSTVPVIIMVERGSEEEEVAALQAGVDAVCTPRHPAEVLIARCRAILRRSQPVLTL